MKIRKGATRLVFVFDKIVIKIPNFTFSWEHFIMGILANINEKNTYRWSREKHLLCPVLWCSWGGWFLVMRKCEPYDGSSKELHMFHFKGDDSDSNYGTLEVKLDYGSLDK